MPFLTEEVWQQLAGTGAGMLIVAQWPDLAPDLADPAATAEMEALIEDLSAIRAVRSELNIPPGARVAVEVRDPDPAAAARIKNHAEHFQRLARVTLKTAAGGSEAKGTVQAIGAGATFALYIGDVVDLVREKARLAKEIAKTEGDLAKVATKLANPAFLANAKAQIVDEQRDREADIRRDRDRLKAAYERLEAV
jgi:valyl-tRNA synthetase